MFIFIDQDRNTKILKTHPRLRVIGRINTSGKGINKKRRGEGRLSLETKRRDRNFDSYQVRYSKPALMSHFKLIMN